jgi:pimeloyl-ACP methyl ester carboxylesterase
VTTIAPSADLEAQRALLEQRFARSVVTLPSGARIEVRQSGERGAGMPLVLLHGISSGAPSWLQVVQALPARQHVIAWDAPGYGESTPLGTSAPRAAHYAARLQELLDVLQVRHWVLAGHSLGALMACAFAANDGDSVKRLVLISPAGGYGASTTDGDRVRRDRGEAMRTLGVAGIAGRIDQRLLSASASAEAREWVRWNATRLQVSGYLQAVEMLAGSELAAVGSVPVEVHCGEADVVTTPAACKAIADRFTAPYHAIPNAGHASPAEQPVAVAALLAAAIDKATGAPSHG